MRIKARIQTLTEKKKKMTSNKMKEWMQKSIVKEAKEYTGIHKNIDENEPGHINENELYEN